MKIFMVLCIVVGLSTACSNQITVRTDYDRAVDIRKYRTFTWLDKKGIEERNNPLYYNELNDKRIKSVVDEQLQLKGYVMGEEGPALKVHYHIVIEDKAQIRTDSYSSYWIDNRRDIYKYREGTLIVDLMDASKGELLWRGWAISALSETDQLSEELIKSAVVKIFVALPAADAKK